MEEIAEGDRFHSPTTAWPWWIAPLALLVGLVLAAVAGLMVDLPAAAFGVTITRSPTPPGLVLADTFVQDLSFVVAAVYCASIGRRAVRSWQFGLRPPGAGWWSAIKRIALLLVAFVVLSVIWTELFNPGEDKLLNTLGSNEGTALLLLSAALTCVMAPICEEFPVPRADVHGASQLEGHHPGGGDRGAGVRRRARGVGSGARFDPLAALGFGLCLLYRYTGSLYPSIVAHSINNSIAFSSLENWDWQTPVLLVSALLAIGAVVMACKSVGLISVPTSFARADA